MMSRKRQVTPNRTARAKETDGGDDHRAFSPYDNSNNNKKEKKKFIRQHVQSSIL